MLAIKFGAQEFYVTKKSVGFVIVDTEWKAFKTGLYIGFGSCKLYKTWGKANFIARQRRKGSNGVKLKVREAFIDVEE